MSEPKLITPLLADHVMGDPISTHHGVRCCPAMRKDSDDKYIVKIISIPASQVQLDALLLSGAYRSKETALAYFKELADAAVEEAALLQRLSKLEGFSAYEGWQVVPMEDEVGYDVYLLGAYRPTLERLFRRSPMTHLGAVNLGLDLCAALSVCRRSGYLYVDLKPGNVFITENQEYRIGDLGFVSLDSLKYASLPDKYRSAYTAPEITDAYSSLNATLDIYAAGLILYQAYNNGELPFTGTAPSDPLPPPAYADYEMAEIIMKACAVDPQERWQDPAQMGQALVNYMQRNSVNDVPIIPPAAPEEPEMPEEELTAEPDVIPEEQVEEVTEDTAIPVIIADAEADTPEEVPTEESPEEASAAEEVTEEEPPVEEIAEEALPVEENPEAEISEAPSEEVTSEAEEETDEEEQFMIAGFLLDETVPTEESTAGLSDAVLSDEVSAMLAQADELIAHKTPDPVVAPEPIDIPMPPPIITEPEVPEEEIAPENAEPAEETSAPAADDEEAQKEALSAAAAVEAAPDEEEYEEDEAEPAPKRKRKFGWLIGVLVTVLILLLLAGGAYYYYENYYLQPVLDIALDGDENYLTVTLDTKIENELLTIVCTDTYGNKLQQPVVNNSATFTGLNPGTSYKVSVEISGFHKLIGTTSTSYATASQTNIVSFTAVTGDTDGSVILNFSVQGPENTAWQVKYSAPGLEELTADCTGHMATITGLEVGKPYTFRLVPVADLYVVGNHTLEYTASNVIRAQNLAIQGFDNGALVATWEVPEGVNVASWTVRCYNNDGFDTTITVSDTQALIENLDPSQSYTVDVKAEGMTVSEWTSISANSVTFKSLLLDDSTPGQLIITWTYEGTAPEGGWRLMYTVDNSERQLIICESNTCTISPIVPGVHYSISFELPDDITVFGGTKEYDAPAAAGFDSYQVTGANFQFRMCWTPEDAGWRWYDMWETDFTTQFAVGEKASFVVHLDKTPGESTDEIATLFVIRDTDGKPILVNAGRTRSWNAMWDENYTELDVPAMPQIPGSYTVEIYFNGALVTTQAFTVA